MIPSTLRRVTLDIYADPSPNNIIEKLFKVRARGSTIPIEVYGGLIQFLSIIGVLAINPAQLSYAGYSRQHTATATAVASAISCILTGILGNLPFVSSPTLAMSIYISLYMKTREYDVSIGNLFSVMFGIIMIICSAREVIDFISKLLPHAIKHGICIGLSLLISIQTLSHLHIIVTGQQTILTLGSTINSEIVISIIAFILIGVLQFFKISGSYVLGLMFGSISFWLINQTFPKELFSLPKYSFDINFSVLNNWAIWECIIDLSVIGAILIAGLSTSLSSLAQLDKPDGSPPRRRWLYFSLGFASIIGGLMGSSPVMISAESAVGISAGARTGLAPVTCGILFLLSAFTVPFWASIPLAGTGPVLLMIGVLLFETTGRVNWNSIK
eukprot:gene13140-17608_t